MEFIEYIGNYKIMKHGEIIIYNDNGIMIDLIENDVPITLKIKFENKGGRVSTITSNIEDNTLIFHFINFERENYIGGIFEPTEVGKLDNGDTLYFNCIVNTINIKEGLRIIKYTFLIKRSNGME